MADFNLLVLLVLAIASQRGLWSSAAPLQGIRIYVADLPKEYRFFDLAQQAGHHTWYSWPVASTVSHPFGKLVDEEASLWTTNQFAADLILHQHIMRSPLRVHSLEEADLVYVPVFLGVTVFNNFTVLGSQDSATRIAEVGKTFAARIGDLLPHLKEKPHFLVVHYESMFTKPKLLLESPLARYLTALVIEINHKKRHGTRAFTVQGNGSDHARPGFFGNVVSIPYPSFFHRHPGMITSLSLDSVKEMKKSLVVAAFNLRKSKGPGPWSIRETLRDQCLRRSPNCLVYDVRFNRESDIPAAMQAFGQAWFCLQPHGDTPTRKSVYDCLMANTIPVVFDQWLLDTFPFASVYDPSNIVAYIPREQIEAKVIPNIVDYLDAQYPIERRLKIMTRILQVKHLYQYSLTPHYDAVTWNALLTHSAEDDSFTMAIKSTAHAACVRGFQNKLCPEELREAKGQDQGL